MKNLLKKESDSMDQFPNFDEKNIEELKKQGVILPQVILTVRLIDGAGLDKKPSKLFLEQSTIQRKMKYMNE